MTNYHVYHYFSSFTFIYFITVAMCVRVWDQVIVHGYRQVIDQMIRELFTFHLNSILYKWRVESI